MPFLLASDTQKEDPMICAAFYALVLIGRQRSGILPSLAAVNHGLLPIAPRQTAEVLKTRSRLYYRNKAEQQS